MYLLTMVAGPGQSKDVYHSSLARAKEEFHKFISENPGGFAAINMVTQLSKKHVKLLLGYDKGKIVTF